MTRGTSPPLAFGLAVSLSNDATITGPDDIISISPDYNFFIDRSEFSYSESQFPTSNLTFSLGRSLVNSTPALSGDLITFQLHDGGSGFTDATIDLDHLRAGIIGIDGTMATDLPKTVHVIVPEPLTLSLLALGGIMTIRRRR